MTPGIPDRLVRVRDIGPRGFLVAIFEDVFGAARPIQRHKHVLDVTEIVSREPTRSRTARNFGAASSILAVHIPTARFGSSGSVATA